LSIMPELQSNRFCAVITYTNAACDEIKNRLKSQINIPSNLFIGTTHSFLIRFIIQPFSSILNFTPTDTIFIDSVKLSYQPKNHFAKKHSEIKLAGQLFSKGIITYDKVLEQSNEIIKNENIASIISNRLQYIFIDEYQDIRLYQHFIIKEIIKQNKSIISCIGDPLQSIFKFSYFTSQLKNEPKPESFEEIPILDMKNNHNTSLLKVNHRSSHNIIQFINNFNKILQQKPPRKKVNNCIPVYFIESTEKQEIIDTFNSLQKVNNIKKSKKDEIHSLFLSKIWKVFEEVAENNKLNKISKKSSSKSQFQEIQRVVLGLIGLTRAEVLKITDAISFRKFCFYTFSKLKTKRFNDERHRENAIRKIFETAFKEKLPTENRGNVFMDDSINQVTTSNDFKKSGDFYSTIHSAKGLEATSVLVCAQTVNELKKWFDTEITLKECDDNNRLGFVAFSRAREMLCISCLKKVSDKLKKKLKELKVKIITIP